MAGLPDKIGEHKVSHLLNVAKQAVAEKTEGSKIMDVAAERRIPKFHFDELTLGRVLGRGGFCVVHEIEDIALRKQTNAEDPEQTVPSNDDEHYIHNIVQDRDFMAGHCIRQGKDCRYALKIVQESSRKDPQLFVNAVVDLAIEARFLSIIRHPNIIKMRAMDAIDPFAGNFYLVLDRLYDIMPTRLTVWKKRKTKGIWQKMTDPRGKRKIAFWVERLTVAYDIACALRFLHQMDVIYRDLKPENIGFDVRGDVKIFDFGLAKELDPQKRLEDGTFKLTGDTGSMRYMAPEVAKSENYNETADVFSFSILLWQMSELKTPYEGFTIPMFQKRVILCNVRPALNPKWGSEICAMLRECFIDNPKRPTMGDVCDVLRAEISKLSDEEIEEMVDESRKSRMSAGE
uniref:Protein kinase domain-containing protein n=1 Tax=Craspedostauros australis TaxID=1486917 RepID=A0A6T6GV67_9STRA|mmetsp:Transcript_21731/g.60510  ORF Transcript_21731/g.60510 Transcript_21731/m.60510 type:complete len:402 (+) Transcript_21731:651-1856(+)